MNKNKLNYYLIGIFLSLVLFSPTVIYYEFTIIITLIISLISLSVNFDLKHKLPLIIALVLVFFLMIIYDGPIKSIIFSFTIIATLIGFTGNKLILYRIFYIVLVFSYIIIILQLIGYNEFFYSWVIYANEASHVAMFSDSNLSHVAYLPQLRPSGLFPAPTYLSLYLILLASIIMFEHDSPGIYQALIGSLLVLSGSTLGLIIFVILILFLLLNKSNVFYLLLGYMLTLISYFYFLPQHAEYNFSILDFQASVFERVMDESIVNTNTSFLFFILTFLFFTIIIISLNYKKSNILDLMPIIILIIGPIILHDVASSFFYSLFVGTAFSITYLLIKPKKIDK